MTTTIARKVFVSAFAAIVATPLARAELPSLFPLQTLEPEPDEISDPDGFPQVPAFASSLALRGDTLLSGLPGVFSSEGRVAIFTRSADRSWVRTGTLKANDAAPGASFGNEVALIGARALVTSNTAVYVFALRRGVWRQTQKVSLGEPGRITDLDWNGSLAVVGVGRDSIGNANQGFHVFRSGNSGRLRHIGKFTAHDIAPGDRFGERVALADASVAVTAPGYNSEQGAAYVFTCSLRDCREQQKLLANDGKPGDDFGSSVDINGTVLIVGATSADPANQKETASRGAGYVFVRPNAEWIETQKLGPTVEELELYVGLGWEVVIDPQRVLISAFGSRGFVEAQVLIYDWSGGSLVPTHVLRSGRQGFGSGYGETLILTSNTAIIGAPQDAVIPIGFADVYELPPDIP